MVAVLYHSLHRLKSTDDSGQPGADRKRFIFIDIFEPFQGEPNGDTGRLHIGQLDS